MPTDTKIIKHSCFCGAELRSVSGWVGHDLTFHMINSGCLSVGEARAELNHGIARRETIELLASWVLDRADQGDHWRAGDPERLPCGCVVSYDREQTDTRCGTTWCSFNRFVVTV